MSVECIKARKEIVGDEADVGEFTEITRTPNGDKSALDVNANEGDANTQLITISTAIAAFLGNDFLGLTEYTNFFKTDNGTRWLDNCFVLNKDFVSHQLHAFVFSEVPTIASAQNAAYSVSDSEQEKCIGAFVVQVGAEFGATSNYIMHKPNINMKVFNTDTSDPRSLWIAWVAGTGVTYTSVDGLSYRIN